MQYKLMKIKHEMLRVQTFLDVMITTNSYRHNTLPESIQSRHVSPSNKIQQDPMDPLNLQCPSHHIGRIVWVNSKSIRFLWYSNIRIHFFFKHNYNTSTCTRIIMFQIIFHKLPEKLSCQLLL